MSVENFHKESFLKIFQDLKTKGKFVSPRGQKVLEIENYSYVLEPYVRFQNFQSRKMNLKYTKDEFLWYLKGDKFDLSICEKAKIWSGIVNSDGTINSNYGQYIFNKENCQFDRVLEILKEDKDSRRGSMCVLAKEHILSNTKDVPCTYSISFRIRDDKLNMSVHMRSQDAVFGMASDAPCFSFIHEMMYVSLKNTYEDLQYGQYFHIADSFHVYERHFQMLEEISSGKDEYRLVDCPKISSISEVEKMKNLDFSSISSDHIFSKWLTQ